MFYFSISFMLVLDSCMANISMYFKFLCTSAKCQFCPFLIQSIYFKCILHFLFLQYLSAVGYLNSSFCCELLQNQVHMLHVESKSCSQSAFDLKGRLCFSLKSNLSKGHYSSYNRHKSTILMHSHCYVQKDVEHISKNLFSTYLPPLHSKSNDQ